MVRRLVYFGWCVLGGLGIIQMLLDGADRLNRGSYRGILPAHGVGSWVWSMVCLLYFVACVYVGIGVAFDTASRRRTARVLSAMALAYAAMLLLFAEEFGLHVLIGASAALLFSVTTLLTMRSARVQPESHAA